MSLVPFDSLPDTSKLWIFAANRQLSHAEGEQFLAAVDHFLGSWQAHGSPVEAGRELRYDQFLFVAANENVTHASGCSIDALTREIQALGTTLGVSLLNAASVFYRNSESVVMIDRSRFKTLAKEGSVDQSTVVFNNGLYTLKELREGKWETTAADSWHAKAFGLQSALA